MSHDPSKKTTSLVSMPQPTPSRPRARRPRPPPAPPPPPPSPPPYTLIPSTSASFITLISDSLRLRHETLGMAFVYMNKYHQFLREDRDGDRGRDRDSDESGETIIAQDLLDDHTLSLAALSLATKATESPRRLREFLLPAYALLHPTADPLTFPSTLYDALRGTLVAAEFVLLRVLRFDIRLPLPFDYLPRFLDKTLSSLDGADHLDHLADDEKDEICVVDVRDTVLGRRAWALAGRAVQSYRLVNLFPARTVATAVFFVVLQENGIRLPAARDLWVRKLAGDRVAYEDFEEAVEEVLRL